VDEVSQSVLASISLVISTPCPQNTTPPAGTTPRTRPLRPNIQHLNQLHNSSINQPKDQESDSEYLHYLKLSYLTVSARLRRETQENSKMRERLFFCRHMPFSSSSPASVVAHSLSLQVRVFIRITSLTLQILSYSFVPVPPFHLSGFLH
jgi:hypothetical protein